MGHGIFEGAPVGNPDGLGFLPLVALSLIPLYATYKAGQLAVNAVQEAKGGGSDDLQPTVDAFKACGNTLAVRGGYRAVPAGPLLGKTCGLANDPLSTGCPSRDLMIQTCRDRGITPEPLVKMSLTEATEANVVEEEEESGVNSFIRSKTALYLGAAVIGALVFMKMRQNRKALVKNPRRRRYYDDYALYLARHVMLNRPTPHELVKSHGLTIQQAQQIDDASSSYGGPGGRSEARFAQYVAGVLKQKPPRKNSTRRRGGSR